MISKDQRVGSRALKGRSTGVVPVTSAILRKFRAFSREVHKGILGRQNCCLLNDFPGSAMAFAVQVFRFSSESWALIEQAVAAVQGVVPLLLAEAVQPLGAHQKAPLA